MSLSKTVVCPQCCSGLSPMLQCDWMNNALTAVYDPKTGGARDFGKEFGPGVAFGVDAISAAGMLPAAYFTAKSLWQPPLK